ncbi:hypothetical protein S7711_06817 [Stachybotrys chartarum IBT 7711]|uniref:Ima1 N-terminal domain-containing protein n=1 Tax=Stachybotrys chartarum (strain CBS 109288 / IBT 7711) TaxID=1280523 RepID=A0A084AYG4_STACB|nr:hypothetical protein S7711_06817 [Stachybotrys chartarum IBT 7711]
MAWLRSSGYLRCFYCGQRSQVKNDGFTREFLCRGCDATNYLDENGDIADPPVANEREPAVASTRYATVAAKPKPQTDSSDDIFCATCLKNQRLYAASLAQYFPDPSHPSYPELERNYYQYRRKLEERYPQVCEDCAVKVDNRIRDAGYLAKTDHLRRMMERSKGRKPTRRVTALDWASSVGSWLWWGGLGLQLFWHLVLAAELLGDRPSPDGMRDPDDQGMAAWLLTLLKPAAAFLPSADALSKWSITASILSVWWNPYFVQVNRGFTRHLLGLTQWYSFQGLIVFFRLVFRVFAHAQIRDGQSANAQLASHLVMAGLIGLIYTKARSSIKVDTTPLFGSEVSVSPKQARAKPKPKPRTPDPDSLADSLPSLDPPRRSTQPLALGSNPSGSGPSSPLFASPLPRTAANTQPQFGSSRFPDTPPRLSQATADPEAMDWSPTPAQPRVFDGFPSASTTATTFGSKPEPPKAGAFWHRVPPAPVNPAQRLRNPPKAPVESKAVKDTDVFFLPKDKKTQERKSRGGLVDQNDIVSFKQPSFFAPEEGSEEANSLADLLSQSFSLREEEAAPRESASDRTGTAASTKPMTLRAVTLAALLAVWLLVCYISIPYSPETRILVMGIAGTIAIQFTGDTSSQARRDVLPSASFYAASIMGVVELAAVCWVAWETWRERVEVRMYGTVVLVSMLGHQIWNTVQ